MAFMSWLGTAGLGLILRCSLRSVEGGFEDVREVVRTLHPQHQLDQLFLRQALQISAIHRPNGSGIAPADKGVGNYALSIGEARTSSSNCNQDQGTQGQDRNQQSQNNEGRKPTGLL